MISGNIVGCYLYLLYSSSNTQCEECGEHFELSELNEDNLCSCCDIKLNKCPQEGED